MHPCSLIVNISPFPITQVPLNEYEFGNKKLSNVQSQVSKCPSQILIVKSAMSGHVYNVLSMQ